MLAIDIPDERSFMHLDTVMTQVDVDKFAVQDAIMDISTIYEITKGTGGELDIVEITNEYLLLFFSSYYYKKLI